MPKGLKRIYGQGHLHFITFSCYRRMLTPVRLTYVTAPEGLLLHAALWLPLLGSGRARNVFVRALDRVRHEYGFKLVGYVAMPEHVHLPISEPARGNPSRVLQMLKQRVSRALRHRYPGRVAATQRSFVFASGLERLPQFWQKRFYDFNVWSRKKKVEKLGYMHANPLKRRLVDDPKDWPWSSYARYQQRGKVLIEIDPVE